MGVYCFWGLAELRIVDLLCTATFSSNIRLLFAVQHVRGDHFAQELNLENSVIEDSVLEKSESEKQNACVFWPLLDV